MSGRWFRLYEDMISDPKVQKLPDWVFKALINMWCLACKNDGIIPEDNLSYALRMRRDHVFNAVDMLFSLGLLERIEGSLVPHNWKIRNPNYKTSTERTRAYRKRERSQERNGTPLEVEVEVDSLGAKAQAKRRTQLPEDWVPPSLEGFSSFEVQKEVPQFRDYHAAKGSVMKDWDAAFRTWMRNSRKFGGKSGGSTVIQGSFRPPIAKTDEGPKITEEERQANLAKLAALKFGGKTI